MCKSSIIFLCVRPSSVVRRKSICLSHYLLLNRWAEFNQICYITSPHGKGVREQHYFSACPSTSRYHLLNHCAEFNQTCYITFPHVWGVREQHYFIYILSYVWVTEFPPFCKRVANSACHLFILWLLYCICLSFPWCWRRDADLIVSFPKLSYLL